jgi:hypothetical protein
VKAIIKFGGNVIKFGKFSPVKLANFVYKFARQLWQAQCDVEEEVKMAWTHPYMGISRHFYTIFASPLSF